VKVSCPAEVFLLHSSDPEQPESKNEAILDAFWLSAGGSTFAKRTIRTRMDDFAKTPRPIASEISDVARDGLILWRLTTSGDRDLWCLVFETSVGFLLVVEDHPEGTEPPRICERHADVIALVNRTDCLKDVFLQDGWTEVDVD
jgi:hypothetical protein